MKKLAKMKLNPKPEKVIKEEELVNLRGGSGGYTVYCKVGELGTICQFDVYSCDDNNWLRDLCLDLCSPFCDSHSCA